MGRHSKIIPSGSGVDRRASAYYSTPKFISEYLLKNIMLAKPELDSILDPCVGCGEMSQPCNEAGINVVGVDVIDMDALGLSEFHKLNFVDYVSDYKSSLFARTTLNRPNAIIANPPYNCHEIDYIRKNKESLRRIFGKHSTLNMYSLFIEAMLDFAEDGAVIAMITHDSFLTSKGHAPLRRKILNDFQIDRLHLCPTDLFRSQGADVRTCLLVLRKKMAGQNHQSLVSNRPATTEEFRHILKNETFTQVNQNNLYLRSESDNSEIVVGVPDSIRELFCEKRVRDYFPCITGISTGNDKKYLRASKQTGFTIPFYKNPGKRKFYSPPNAFLSDDFLKVSQTDSVFTVRNKKHLFKSGITCSSMGVKFGAVVLPSNSTFGVNSTIIVDENDKWWVLAFLNSNLATYLTRGMMIRSNMITAGYTARIPIPKFDEDIKDELTTYAKTAYVNAQKENYLDGRIAAKIDHIIYDSLRLSDADRSIVDDFVKDVVRLT